MSMPEISPLKRAWYRWKMMRLPWRKRFLVGLDLRGNTYWIFRDQRPEGEIAPHAQRWRRIVQYPRSTHYSDVKVPPQWHQWLRHQREHPPSLNEQQADIARQARMKTLAAEADARWEAKPSLTGMPRQPDKEQPAPVLDTGRTQPSKTVAEEGTNEEVFGNDGKRGSESKTEMKDDPWKKAASGPSENWQPTAWSPTSTRKR